MCFEAIVLRHPETFSAFARRINHFRMVRATWRILWNFSGSYTHPSATFSA